MLLLKNLACVEEGRGVYRFSIGKHVGKRIFGRPRRTWQDNNKMALLNLCCGDMEWIELAQYWDRCRAVANVVLHLRVKLNARSFLIRSKPVSFTR